MVSKEISYYFAITSDARDSDRYDASDFVTFFSQPIKLPNMYDWYIALDKAALWYSYPNVSATSYDNAKFTYYNGSAWKDVTIDEGNYSISDLNTAIQAAITAQGDTGTNIAFVPNFNTQKVEVQFLSSYEWDPSTSQMYLLFGFSDAQAAGPISVNTVSDNIANVTNGITSLYIKTDLLEQSFQNTSGGQVIYSFLPDGPPGSIIDIDPPERVYVQLRKNYEIQNIRIYVQDNLNRTIDFRGDSTSYTFHLKGVLKKMS
jgi:hypothetical protein